MKCQHINTEEAVQIHEDVRAHKSIAMHWGTFVMTPEVICGWRITLFFYRS